MRLPARLRPAPPACLCATPRTRSPTLLTCPPPLERYGHRLPSYFLPLREVSARELRRVCSRWALPLADPLPAAGDEGAAAGVVDKRTINSLAAAFIAGMEKHNPGGRGA